jgi:hypothetical protein
VYVCLFFCFAFYILFLNNKIKLKELYVYLCLTLCLVVEKIWEIMERDKKNYIYIF